MPINPSDYNVDELREAPSDNEPFGAAGGNRTPIELGSPMSADEALQPEVYRELFLLQSAMTSESLEKPYLTTIPDEYACEMLVFEWLDSLQRKVGLKGTLEALRYYETIGWITEQAEHQLRDYLSGLDVTQPTDPANLNRDDHMLSLVFLARVASMV